jgi:hypothetical protein
LFARRDLQRASLPQRPKARDGFLVCAGSNSAAVIIEKALTALPGSLLSITTHARVNFGQTELSGRVHDHCATMVRIFNTGVEP